MDTDQTQFYLLVKYHKGLTWDHYCFYFNSMIYAVKLIAINCVLQMIGKYFPEFILVVTKLKFKIVTNFMRNVNINFEYEVQQSLLEDCYIVKNLGIIFNSKLTFSSHIKLKISEF